MSEQLNKALHDVIGNTLFSATMGIFDRMDIAEQEISAVKARYPEQAARLHECFGMLCPSDVLSASMPIDGRLFRSHCEQLLERVANDEKLEPPTDAEIVCICSQASLVAPLQHDYAYLYFRFFRKIFPDLLPKLEDYEHQETWQGASDALLERLLKKSIKRKKIPEFKQLAINLFENVQKEHANVSNSER